VWYSGRRYELGIVLPASLGREEIIVPAARALRITPADSRPGIINGALAFLCIQKPAHLSEDVVLLMSKYSTNGGVLCVAPLGLLVRNSKVVGDAKDVALGYLDAIIATAIGWTFRTVVHYPQRTVGFL
jgi:hypothetical protein